MVLQKPDDHSCRVGNRCADGIGCRCNRKQRSRNLTARLGGLFLWNGISMNKANFPLVTAVGGEARASSEVIAHGVEQQHASVIKLVRKHQADFEAFGPIGFEIRKGRALKHGGFAKATEYAMLNEHQASLLIAFMRNTPKVIEFKVALIREFFRMRDELQSQSKNLWQQMHALIAREVESKVKASFGSHLMLDRKRQIPLLESERRRLEIEIQPSLLN